MKAQRFLPTIFGLICMAAVGMTVVQHQQLLDLRAQQQQLTANLAADADNSNADAPERKPSEVQGPSAELLQLRNQVGQLLQRKRELESVRLENDRLHAQLAVRNANTNRADALPLGYILTKDAHWVGMSKPEDTLQSLLWAIQNRDYAAFTNLITPESVEKMSRQGGMSPEQFFSEAPRLPGFRIIQLQNSPDGTVEAKVEMVPGEGNAPSIRFRQMEGSWKLDMIH
jgi:hypothetical protein